MNALCSLALDFDFLRPHMDIELPAPGNRRVGADGELHVPARTAAPQTGERRASGNVQKVEQNPWVNAKLKIAAQRHLMIQSGGELDVLSIHHLRVQGLQRIEDLGFAQG